ncbi:MAG: IspD/TarI family cytidylyltransferase [Bacilli bacterium]
MKKIAAIFAGGVGQRMGGTTPKQFLKIYGKEIIIHTLEKFQYNNQIDLIYVGCKKEYIEFLKELVDKYNISKIPVDGIVEGGLTGQDTIYNILIKIREENPGNSIVLIHDGVRPLINDEIIDKNIKCVEEYGTSITCCSVFETPIISNDGLEVDKVLDRKKVYVAKAPQCFVLDQILEAHEKVRNTKERYENKKIVDSCSLFKSVGNDVHLIEGNRENIKVTTVEDYINLLAMLLIDDQKQIFKLLEDKENE